MEYSYDKILSERNAEAVMKEAVQDYHKLMEDSDASFREIDRAMENMRVKCLLWAQCDSAIKNMDKRRLPLAKQDK